MRIEPPQIRRVSRPGKTWMATAGLVLTGLVVTGLLVAATGALIGWTDSREVRRSSSRLSHRTQSPLESFAHWFDSAAKHAEVPTLTLDIKFRHLQALRDSRAAWRASGVRLAAEENETSASVRQGGRSLDVTVALAGAPLDQGPFEFGQLRIAVKGEGDLFGMKKLLLDDPDRPEFLQEALYYACLQRAGLLAPKLQVVQLVVNGKDWGTAVAVEQPAVEALALHDHADGVLVGWDPALQPGSNKDALAWLDPRTVEPVVEGARRIEGTALADQAGLAVGQMRALMRGTLSAEQVVDVHKTARFLALSEIWGMSRALHWHATRWVMHPVTLRLEPFVRLPSGADAGRLVDGLAMAQRLLDSPVFRAEYEAALREEAKRLDAKELNGLAQGLATGWPAVVDIDVQVETLPVLARCRQVLDVTRLVFMPAPATLPQLSPLAVPPPLDQVMPFAKVDAERRVVLVPAGEWTLPASVQIPQSYSLSLAPGARLRFAAGAWLVVHGPCLAEGTAQAPIELTGALQDGKPQPWGGVLIIGGTGTRWRQVTVRDAVGQGQGAWQPRAAIVLVDGDADLADVRVADIGGEAVGLRSVGVRLQLGQATFEHIAGSAVQIEQGHANIADLQVRGSGGDGLDSVSATVVVKRMQVADAAGAALRAGLRSEVTASHVSAERLGNGLVARDGAVLRASASRIADVRHLGYLAYNQGAGSAPARIEVQDVAVQRARQAHLCTGGGAVTIQGRAQDCTAVSVQQLVAAGIARR